MGSCLLIVCLALLQDDAADAAPSEPPSAGSTAALPAGRDDDTVVITASRSAERALDTPYSTEVVSGEELERRAYRSLPQALRDLPGVMVQETAHGQGSPYLRGFTGFRTLLLIDGIRLNDSTLREGPNQYWNTVDSLSIERLEVVAGPSSVLYGSDAIGGTVNAITRGPYGYGAEDSYGGELLWRGATAENYQQGRLELSFTRRDDLGLLLGASRKDFGDVRGGSDVGTQENTGYDEQDGDVKLEAFLSDHARLVVAHQRVDQDDVPRTHSTVFAEPWRGTTVGSDLRRDLDQKRELTYVQLHTDDVDGIFDGSVTSLSWHAKDEVQDRIRSSGAREQQGVEVGTLGLFSHFHKSTGAGRIGYGFEYYHDDVDSFLDRFGAQTAADDIQGPVADDATYELFGLYLQDEIPATERLDVTLGARFSHAAADADSVRDPVTDERISIDDEWSDVVGSARFDYRLGRDGDAGAGRRMTLFGGASQGFRAPNLSDLTRFDSARSNEFEIPAPDLEPERFTTFELGVKIEEEELSARVALFHTEIDDQIVRVPTGATNAAGEVEVTKDNVGDGFVQGVELGAAWRVRPEWTLFGNATWLDGELDTFPTSSGDVQREPLDRLMPFTVQLGVGWEDPGGRAWAEALCVHAEEADELSTRDESDTQRIPPGGTPGYTVYDLRGGWRFDDSLTLTLALENVFDEDYRIHGSGLNRPGRNLVVGLRWSF